MGQAQLLQCPDCGFRHDLAALGDVFMFRCEQCGRALKVPAQFRDGAPVAPPRPLVPVVDPSAPAPAPTPIPASAPNPASVPVRAPTPIPAGAAAPDSGVAPAAAPPETTDTTDTMMRAAPPGPATRPAARRRRGARPHVPLGWRLLIWVVSVPIGLLVVFQLLARKLGWLSQNDLLDAFTAGGWDRFRPIAQLLPLAAFVIALMVQVGVYGVERWYRRKMRQVAVGALAATADEDRAARPTGS